MVCGLSFHHSTHSLDDLVGESEHRRWHDKPQSFRGLDIDDQLKFRRLLRWKVLWSRPLEYAIGDPRKLTEDARNACAIGYEPASLYCFAKGMDRWQSVLSGEGNEALVVTVSDRAARYHQGIHPLAPDAVERLVDVLDDIDLNGDDGHACRKGNVTILL